MKKIIYFLFIAVFCNSISAQNDTLKLTLNQALQLGLANRFDIKGNHLNIDIARNRLIKSNKELLPDLSANGKLVYYGELQPSIIPAGYLGFTEPKKIAIGMKNNTSFSLDLNYVIYKPGLYTDIKIASNNLALEEESNNKSDINIKIEIAEAYDNTLLKSFQYEIALKNENRYKEYYDLTRGKYGSGVILESDMLLAELDYKNAIASTEKQKQDYMLSTKNLRYKINIPDQTVIILTDSLHSSEEADRSDVLAADALTKRSEIKQLAIEQAGNELQLKKAKQNNLPSFSLFANYTQFFQGPAFNYSNNFYWAPVNYIGVKLSLPLIGNIKNINSVKEYKLRSAQTDFILKQKTADIQYEVQESITRLNNARQNLVTAKDNYQLSQKVYELKKQQYDSGSFSYEKLLDTEKSLSATEQEYISAVYSFLIAKISYQKAIGDY
jgi:outer membrane protein TolC